MESTSPMYQRIPVKSSRHHEIAIKTIRNSKLHARFVAAKLNLADLKIVRHKSRMERSNNNGVVTDSQERICFSQSLKGIPEIDERTRAEMAAVGGLRDAHASVSRLASVRDFGRGLGDELMRWLRLQHEDAILTGSGSTS